MKVGIRELKSRLSAYIEQARRGETVVITDRGKVVAQLVPSTETELPGNIKRLVDEGRLILKPPPRNLPPPIKMLPGSKSLQEYVSEQRR
jgi:prevent-host-death family protein